MSLGSSPQPVPPHLRPLDRQQMEAVIAGGQSVLYGGRIIVQPHHLPSDAELASGDPVKEQAATRGLQDQIARLQQTLDDLTSGKFRKGPETGGGGGAAAAAPGPGTPSAALITPSDAGPNPFGSDLTFAQQAEAQARERAAAEARTGEGQPSEFEARQALLSGGPPPGETPGSGPAPGPGQPNPETEPPGRRGSGRARP